MRLPPIYVLHLPKLVHDLQRVLDTQERGRIRRESPCHGRSESLEKRLHTIFGNRLARTIDKASVGALRRALVARLDDVWWDREGPHRHAC